MSIVQVVIDCKESLCLRSPAKLNLSLRIVGRRGDGYHLLDSVFWPIDFCDELRVLSVAGQSKDALQIVNEVPGQEFPDGSDNLVLRALRLARERLNDKLPFLSVTLTKRIPAGGGLGGGSSNAGTLLAALCQQGLLPRVGLAETALALGADVPFFLTPSPTRVGGIGERTLPLCPSAELLENLWFLLVLPPRSSPTPGVFAEYRAGNQAFSSVSGLESQEASKLGRKELSELLASAGNDLEAPAVRLNGEIGVVLARLRALNSEYAGMSGSGSSCFAVFLNREKAEHGAKVLAPFFREAGCRGILVRSFLPPH